MQTAIVIMLTKVIENMGAAAASLFPIALHLGNTLVPTVLLSQVEEFTKIFYLIKTHALYEILFSRYLPIKPTRSGRLREPVGPRPCLSARQRPTALAGGHQGLYSSHV